MPSHEVRAVHLPYCIEKLQDGRYVVLNRNYKPLGFSTRSRVEYEQYPIPVKLKGLTRKVAARLSWDGSEDLEKIYFYNDGCIPTTSANNMSAYLERLAIFAKLKIDG